MAEEQIAEKVEYLLSIGEMDKAKQTIFIELTDAAGFAIKHTVIRGFPVYTPTLTLGIERLDNALNLFDSFSESLTRWGGIAP